MSSTSFDVEKNILIRAGAGAGKTTTLIQTVLDFAQKFEAREKRLPRIVLTTFTRKATQEIRERLSAQALQLNDPKWIQFVTSRGKLQITTIHGVFSLLLNRFGSQIGLAPNYQIVSGPKADRLLGKSLKKTVLKHPSIAESFSFKELRSYARSYFSWWCEFENLKSYTSQDFECVYLKQALNEIAKFKKILREERVGVTQENWATYLDELTSRLIEFEKCEDWPALFRLIKIADANMKAPQRRAKGGVYPVSEEFVDQHKQFKNKIEEWLTQSQLFLEAHDEIVNAMNFFMADLSQDWLNVKLTSGQLEMADIENLAVYLWRKFPDSATKFAQTFDYWMVDEYQDTSALQMHLLKHLIHDRPHFVVGDPQQSIYLFRGAQPGVFQLKQEEFQESDHQVRQRMSNYRTDQNVLSFINHYFVNWNKDQFSQMEPQKNLEASGVQVLLQESVESDDGSAKRDDAFAVVKRCQELAEQGVNLENICVLARKNSQLQKIAELSIQCGLEVQLHGSGQFASRPEVIDALALLQFFVNPHDNENLVRLMRAPWIGFHDSAIAYLAKKISREISYWQVLQEEKFEDNEVSFVEAVESLKRILQLCYARGFSEAFEQALLDFKILESAQLFDGTGRREANLFKLVFEVRQASRQMGFNLAQFIREISSTRISEEGADSDAAPVVVPSRINLMTIHASKGLQFEHVIIPYMAEASSESKTETFYLNRDEEKWTMAIPYAEEGKDEGERQHTLVAIEGRRRLNELEREESQRLLYVAMTRVQKGLTLIWSVGASAPKRGFEKSWAAHFPFSTEVGEHELPATNNLQAAKYLVRREDFSVQYKQQEQRSLVTVREPLNFAKSERVKSLSVTNAIASKESNKAQAMSVGLLSERLAPALIGEEVHAFFEALRFHEASWLADHMPQYVKSDWFKWFESQKNLIYLIKNGEAEWGFTLQKKNEVGQIERMSGQIDLWGRDQSGTAWIVDYKTGSSRHVEKAFAQLEKYAEALRVCSLVQQGEKVRLAAVFVFEQKIFEREI